MDDDLLIGAVPAADDDIRKAALLLHTLSGADRDWMLARLPAEYRRQLLDLVEELRELGIPPVRSMLDAMKDGTAARRASASTPADDSWEAWCAEIDRASPSMVWPILRAEPEQLIARVLSLHDWRWAAGISQWLDPMRRTTVRVLLERNSESRHEDARALDAYLLSGLGTRIRALPAEVHPSERLAEQDEPVSRRAVWQWPIFGRQRERGR
ncbi:hypothetical protein GQ57_33960 [Burkholderia sp. MSh2]|uniref:Uncharacterized protein n=1 Tax=Burkholderia paludis TaxID=1506587 RepID=A0A6P2S2M0_9BURK|nr:MULTISPECIES: hypothetical protein [Burkholderia]KEZ01650.1 hypothetical protein GQ57_33960 [Burkholderia sp. MSh2]KFG97858.1 hypothetical protein GQ56_0108210 [Burkholderia paludis]CAB3759887.1 hypothetical protein LMG30113_03552 [Burkholderia paludis]VWC43722.1 hypothetical protein BPA30113_07123 [Burkholderia paludis]